MSLNISDFSLFFMEKLQSPLQKGHPLFSKNPPSKKLRSEKNKIKRTLTKLQAYLYCALFQFHFLKRVWSQVKIFFYHCTVAEGTIWWKKQVINTIIGNCLQRKIWWVCYITLNSKVSSYDCTLNTIFPPLIIFSSPTF